MIDAILHKARTGCRWQDLPERFGLWKSIHSGAPKASGTRSCRRCPMRASLCGFSRWCRSSGWRAGWTRAS
ncbi:transposase [Streptomyces anulatus]|uniref:transposase n=1 Tax=Streptomyces anulatus TaxID=1892 RepID=UPI003BF5A3A6